MLSTDAVHRLQMVSAGRNNVLLAERALRAAIATAYNSRDGQYTVADIAEAAQLTRERVHQIVKEEADRK